MKIPFIDLKSQYDEIKKDAERSLKKLMQRGDFILGQDVRSFEKSFAEFIGTKYGLGVNSGTDALFFSLLSLGIGPGDEVIVPAFTYIASAFAVTYTGAKPVFVDIDERTYNLDPAGTEKAITKRTKAIMPVHLYGQATDIDAIIDLAKRYNLKVIEDAAQAHGTEYISHKVTRSSLGFARDSFQSQGHKKIKVGSIGDVGCFSFYPTKNLGAFGDGGMVVTNDKTLFEKLARLRDYGRKSKYEHISLGYNSRLDAIQAVFLKEKLKHLDSWNKKRIEAARYYKKLLKGVSGITIPFEAQYGRHIYHVFAVRVKNRGRIIKGLNAAGIQTGVYYPIPLHLQPVYKNLSYKKGDLPVSEQLANEVLALPIYPHITKQQIEYVVEKLKGLINHE